jgi:hypothetical protein
LRRLWNLVKESLLARLQIGNVAPHLAEATGEFVDALLNRRETRWHRFELLFHSRGKNSWGRSGLRNGDLSEGLPDQGSRDTNAECDQKRDRHRNPPVE